MLQSLHWKVRRQALLMLWSAPLANNFCMCGLSCQFSFSTHGCLQEHCSSRSIWRALDSVCYDLYAIQPLNTLQRILGAHTDAQNVCYTSYRLGLASQNLNPVEEPLNIQHVAQVPPQTDEIIDFLRLPPVPYCHGISITGWQCFFQ